VIYFLATKNLVTYNKQGEQFVVLILLNLTNSYYIQTLNF